MQKVVQKGGVARAAPSVETTAFATLSDQYRDQLFRAAYRITRNREDAEDAVQDSLLRAFVHLRDFEGRSNFGTWLTRITINSALMILRKKRAMYEIPMPGDDDVGRGGLTCEMADHSPTPETYYAQTEEERILRTAIRSLRQTLQVGVQIQLQGLSIRKTAEATGISLEAAKGRLFRAKKALRRSVIPKLVHQSRFAAGGCVLRPRATSQEKFSGFNRKNTGREKDLSKECCEVS